MLGGRTAGHKRAMMPGRAEPPPRALSDEAALAALRSLLHSAHVAGPDDLPSLLTEAGAQMGAVAVELYLIDYDQLVLVPLASGTEPSHPSLPVDGTMAGRAFTDISQLVSIGESESVVWTISLDGTDRLGVICHHFPTDLAIDDRVRDACRDAAALAAELVVTRSLYGDAIERARRRGAMTVPAEIQWRLLPPLTFMSADIAVAGSFHPPMR